LHWARYWPIVFSVWPAVGSSISLLLNITRHKKYVGIVRFKSWWVQNHNGTFFGPGHIFLCAMRDARARARNSAMVIRSPLALARRPWPAKEDVRQYWSTARARTFVRVDACHRPLPAFDTDQARCSNWLANAAHRGADELNGVQCLKCQIPKFG
jgi:hypothetical protein